MLCCQDVFTVSVGNLPPRCTAVIKITYVAELVVDGDHISFRVPGSVAPWTEKAALDSETQTTVDTVRVGGGGGDVSVHVAVEMPFDIRSITSPTHRLRIKVLLPSHDLHQTYFPAILQNDLFCPDCEYVYFEPSSLLMCFGSTAVRASHF